MNANEIEIPAKGFNAYSYLITFVQAQLPQCR